MVVEEITACVRVQLLVRVEARSSEKGWSKVLPPLHPLHS